MRVRAPRARPAPAAAPELPRVSVVIPTYNEARFIGRCLESVRSVDYPADRLEIIVVDNGSTDETVAIARRYASRVVVRPGVTIAALRNAGCTQATGEVFAFIDADCVAAPDWLRNAVSGPIAEGCVTGSAYRVPDDGTWVEKAWFAQRPEGRREVRYLNAGNLLVPAAVFRRIGGFREDLVTAEDDDFCVRVRAVAPVVSDDQVSVTHLGNPKTLRDFLRREIWLGYGSLRWLAGRWHTPVLGATLLCAALSLAQAVGLGLALAGAGWALFGLATAGVGALLLLSVVHRRAYLRSVLDVPRLLVLYYLFYVGRTIGLGYFLSGRPFRRRK